MKINLSIKEQHTPSPELRVPDWIRLPAPGKRCAYTGLSRTSLNNLILPNKGNGFSAPVKSRSLKASKYAERGIRLINYRSLMDYIESQTAFAK